MSKHRRTVRWLGRCWICELPVNAARARHVADSAVRRPHGGPVRRLVHSGECHAEAVWRVQTAEAAPEGGPASGSEGGESPEEGFPTRQGTMLPQPKEVDGEQRRIGPNR